MPYSVLLLGATGYLGGDVLTTLEQAGNYEITCVVRPERKASFNGRKVSLLVASHDELVKIEDACVDVDIVINAATSDDLELTKAINRGLAKGKADSNKSGVLVHVSGTQLIESRPTGRLEDVPKYDDLDVEQIKSIPDSALHRLIDLEHGRLAEAIQRRVVRADLAGKIKASIICPGVIFGRGTGPLKTISSQFPNMVRLALKNKRAIYAGEGTNIWAHVHVKDVSDMTVRCIKQNLEATIPAGFERFYFAENGEHQKLRFSTQMALILHAHGLISEPTPYSVPIDNPEAPNWANRTTARCFARRARQDFGWAPTTLLENVFEAEILDIVSAIQPEMEHAL